MIYLGRRLLLLLSFKLFTVKQKTAAVRQSIMKNILPRTKDRKDKITNYGANVDIAPSQRPSINSGTSFIKLDRMDVRAQESRVRTIVNALR